MEREYKNLVLGCQNCHKEFTIEPEDFLFYEKIKVPPPTWCPMCRLARRISFINSWSIQWRNCNKCGKKTLSKNSSSQDIIVYCPECWWADDWDGTEYSTEYDPNKTFLEQVKSLFERTPHVSSNSAQSTNTNCLYTNGVAWSKDCHLTFWADYCDNVYYSSLLNNLKHSADCIRGYYSELCYESVGFSRCYRMFYSDECDDCIDVWFSRNCYNCQNCIACVNLSGASYCIFNEKFSKEEYEKKLKEFSFDSWDRIKELENKAHRFWLTKPYRSYHGHSLNYNVTGDYIYTSKNSKEGYILNGAEDCKYCQFITVPSIKNCHDYSGWGNNANYLYEVASVGEGASSVNYSLECWPDVMNLQYCMWSVACKDCFGCANLKRKQFCILNKQYTKEEYHKLKEEIIKDMNKNPYIDKLGRKFIYGEFFPLEFSEFAYNNSNAMRFIKKTKEEAIKEGYFWNDSEKSSGNSTMKASELPENLKDVNITILKEAIECVSCGKVYNIAQGELDLLKKLMLPLPHECPKCRENKRFERMTMPGLYDRQCDKCGEKIKTPYAPDRPEIVYCEKCYQQEVY